MLATSEAIAQELASLRPAAPSPLIPSNDRLSRLLAQNPCTNIPVELGLQRSLLDRLAALHTAIMARERFFRDVSDYPQRFATQSDVDDLDLANLDLEQELAFAGKHVANLKAMLAEKVDALEAALTEGSQMQQGLADRQEGIKEIKEKTARVQREMDQLSDPSNETEFNEKSALVNSLSVETEEMAAALTNLQHTHTKLGLVHASLQEEIALAKPALAHLQGFVKDMQDTAERADPRITYLGNWVREAISLLQIVTGVLAVQGDETSFNVRYNDNIGLKARLDPATGRISVESPEVPGCVFTDLTEHVNAQDDAGMSPGSKLLLVLTEAHTRLGKHVARQAELDLLVESQSQRGIMYDRENGQLSWQVAGGAILLVGVGPDYPALGNIQVLDVQRDGHDGAAKARLGYLLERMLRERNVCTIQQMLDQDVDLLAAVMEEE